MSKTSSQESPAPERRQRLGTTAQVAEHLELPERTLVQWRYKGTGPRFIRVGKHVRYRWADVERWLDENASDPNAA